MAFKRQVLETGRGERAEMQLSFGVIDACYDMIVEPIRDDSGRVTGLACAAIDLTDRRRAERERDHLLDSERAARADAERAGRMKDEFLATLSHELRTPLNAMLGWAQVLQHHAMDARVLRGLQVIERNVRVQSQLIDDLLDMSRILSGKVRLLLEPIELAPIVEAAVETLRPSAELKGIELACTRGPATSGLVRADPTRLQQIVLNLLMNAIKFTPSGGKVSVRVEAAHGERRIVIADTGCGIDSEFLPHVFERFRQADASSTRRHGGLGLGLAITRHLVEMHGGRVEAHSEGADRGSVFTVALPVIEAVASEESASALRGRRHGQPVVLDGIRVLVVDDDADARELAEHVLRERGAEVETASSVSDAMEVLTRGAAGRPGQRHQHAGYRRLRSDRASARITRAAGGIAGDRTDGVRPWRGSSTRPGRRLRRPSVEAGGQPRSGGCDRDARTGNTRRVTRRQQATGYRLRA